MVKIINDVHADPDIIESLLSLKIKQGDILVANGDLIGSRGKTGNKIVNIFYKVKHGEAPIEELEKTISEVLETKVSIEDELVSKAIHSGTFLAEMCRRYDDFRTIIEDEAQKSLSELDRISKRIKEQGGELIYLPGNCEITISDFDITTGVEIEKTLPPKERLFNRLEAENVFEGHGTKYVNQPEVINGNTLLVPIDSLDEWIAEKTTTSIPFPECITNLIVHYPPYDPIVLDRFYKLFGYQPNEMDNLRMEAVSEIVKSLPNLEQVIFGHIHPGVDKESLERLPGSIIFPGKDYELVWNCPGSVCCV
ncbi:metallophosphoesterase [Candidatus Saccharibacteria bacterium]|nr:metallophosphoesterase [Candidatus Saccharibacteria bacterium]